MRRIYYKITSVLLLLAMFFSVFSESLLFVSALEFDDPDVDPNPQVTAIVYQRDHNGFGLVSSSLKIIGSGIDELSIRNSTFQSLDEYIFTSSDNEIEFKFEISDQSKFDGTLRINGQAVEIVPADFPSFDGSNIDEVVEEGGNSLTLYGDNLNLIDGTNIKSSYFIIASDEAPIVGGVSEGEIEITPSDTKHFGSQDININKEDYNAVDDLTIIVDYNYSNAFKIFQPMDLGSVSMGSDIVTGGGIVRFEVDKEFFINTEEDLQAINDEYNFYFVNKDQQGSGISDDNKGVIVGLVENNILELRIPEIVSNVFSTGTKEIVIVKRDNEEIISRYDYSEDKEHDLTVIGSTNVPSIESINPSFASENGEPVQLVGSNLFTTSNISGFKNTDGTTIENLEVDVESAATTNEGTRLEVLYDVGEVGSRITYNGFDVEYVKRIFNVIIENNAKFDDDAIAYMQVSETGNRDELNIVTPVSSVDDDKNVEAILEVETIIKLEDDGLITFYTKDVWDQAFVIVPSSITPEVDSVQPNKLNVTSTGELKENTQILIEGENFYVDKYVEGNDTIIHYPKVLIQVVNKAGDTEDIYQLKIDVNDSEGQIKYSDLDDPEENPFLGNDGEPLEIDMVVLDDNYVEVDGTQLNKYGTKILITLPAEVPLSTGKKNIQIINPTKGSEVNGKSGFVYEELNVIRSKNIPVIKSVDPSTITADGEDEITLVATGVIEPAIFIDGKRVNITESTTDISGDTIIKFKAPVGRLGQTWLQLINELDVEGDVGGGIDVTKFYYVRSFDQDPIITDISPDSGAAGTLVVITGENFYKHNPNTTTFEGLDIYKLIGSRVFLDGKEVNQYNKDIDGDIVLEEYVAPRSGSQSLPLLAEEYGSLVMSPFYENSIITNDFDLDSDELRVYEIQFDGDNNPLISNGLGEEYTLKYEDGIKAYKNGILVGSATVESNQIAVDDNGASKVYRIVTDNNILRIDRTIDESYEVALANYYDSIVLRDSSNELDADFDQSFFILEKRYDGYIYLSNAQEDGYYMIQLNDDNDGFKAISTTNKEFTLEVDESGITVEGFFGETDMRLEFLTPYKSDSGTDSDTREIYGNKVTVKNSRKIEFYVPSLSTGSGYKDVSVANPDTRDFDIDNGFNYVHLPSSYPVISSISPKQGSTEGGFVVVLEGSSFSSDVKIYVDGMEVSSSDINVLNNGTRIEVILPEYPYDLGEVFQVDSITVPIVIVNGDGGSANSKEGFVYVTPESNPVINPLRDVYKRGSTNGGDIVELTGIDFRFFEPYENLVGGLGYDEGGDRYTNLNSYLEVNEKWDDFRDPELRYATSVLNGEDIDLWEAKSFETGLSYFGFDKYYSSNIFPKVYFGTKEAQIVDFASSSKTSTGMIKVITPSHTAGTVDIKIINNDSGISNTVDFVYDSSKPKINYISPDSGSLTGYQVREIYGTDLARSTIRGFVDDEADELALVEDVEALVRFGNLTDEQNIYADSATVNLDGNMTVEYKVEDLKDIITMSIQKDNQWFTRDFDITEHDGEKILLSIGMLKSGNNYYKPSKFNYSNETEYNDATDYEFVMVQIVDEPYRMVVERGYAPIVDYDDSSHLILRTPSYHTIDTVNVTYYNPDGGIASSSFTYTNPDSVPIIEKINPSDSLPANTVENQTNSDQYMVQSTINGGIDIEIKGHDFRDGAVVRIGNYEAEVLDITYDEVSDLDVIIASVPAASTVDIDMKYAISVINADGGIANSTDTSSLGVDKNLIYFIYRKPLSLPEIIEINPVETSQYGGNTITITGTDFREGAKVIIGSIGGVPVTPDYIEDVGRIIRFTVPSGLTAGAKNIQVINEDFGTSTLEDALTIISYPTVSATIKTEDGSRNFEWASVEGGQKVMITGDDFQDGAIVLLDATRVEDTLSAGTGVTGYFRDDKTYILQGGYQASDVEFVDKNKLIVTLPEVFKEMDYNITVINPDKGMSDNNASIKYSVPVPSDPVRLDAEVINDQYIKLSRYTSANADYYEIYVYIGKTKNSTLKSNDYKDFSWLGTTDVEPFKITKLNGLENIKKGEYVKFVVRAVNKYGPSGWSDIESLSYSTVDDIEEIGEADDDGDIFVDRETGAEKVLTDKTLDIVLTNDEGVGNIYVDLRESTYSVVEISNILIGSNLIKKSFTSVEIEFMDSDISFMPYIFNTDELVGYEKLSDDPTYVDFEYRRKSSESTDYMIKNIARNKKQISDIFGFNGTVKNNNVSEKLTDMRFYFDFKASYDESVLDYLPESGIKLYWYNQTSDQWEAVDSMLNTETNSLTAQVENLGYYIILADR